MRLFTYALMTFSVLCPPTFAAEQTASWEVCFTPGGNCTDVIVGEIGAARKSVLVQAHSFSSQPIADALVKAKGRGVDVRVILDQGQLAKKWAIFLANGRVAVLIDDKHASAHNKVMIIDDEKVITGSFNFKRSAQERNAENLLVLKDGALAARYAENWRTHAEHSEKYGRK